MFSSTGCIGFAGALRPRGSRLCGTAAWPEFDSWPAHSRKPELQLPPGQASDCAALPLRLSSRKTCRTAVRVRPHRKLPAQVAPAPAAGAASRLPGESGLPVFGAASSSSSGGAASRRLAAPQRRAIVVPFDFALPDLVMPELDLAICLKLGELSLEPHCRAGVWLTWHPDQQVCQTPAELLGSAAVLAGDRCQQSDLRRLVRRLRGRCRLRRAPAFSDEPAAAASAGTGCGTRIRMRAAGFD